MSGDRQQNAHLLLHEAADEDTSDECRAAMDSYLGRGRRTIESTAAMDSYLGRGRRTIESTFVSFPFGWNAIHRASC
jgi:hypothetical protein